MEINLSRLKENIKTIGEIGKVDGKGITRVGFSSEFNEASKKLIELMKKANLKVTVDEVGNVFGRREGRDSSLPSIMIGSHLDTVPNGGLFDGNLGVNAALECMFVLNEEKQLTNHPIEIVAFNAEEGHTVGGTFGSRAFMGLIDPYEEGLEENLKQYGLGIESIKNSVRNMETIKAFLELHIEQGGNLDANNIPIGIVNGIAGITRYRISVIGEANHAGTTSMRLRKDALIGAATLLVEIDTIAKEMGEPFVATVGTINISPGAVNVIPGSVEFVLEVRDLHQNKIDYAIQRIKESTKKIDTVDFKFELLINKPAVMTSECVMDIIEKTCRDRNIKYKIMASGAGHDAKTMAIKKPTGMIFVPSKDGKSHCPEEWTEWKDIEVGVNVLLNTIMEIDRCL